MNELQRIKDLPAGVKSDLCDWLERSHRKMIEESISNRNEALSQKLAARAEAITALLSVLVFV